MNKQDWYNMGAQIGDLVQSAIDNQDFQQLNQSITKAINETLDLVQKNMQNLRQNTGEQRDQAGEQNTFGQQRDAGDHRQNGDSWQSVAGSWREAYERAAGGRRKGAEEWKRNPGGDEGRSGSGKAYHSTIKTEQGYGRIRFEAEKGRQETQDASARALKSYKGVTYMAVGYTFAGIFGVLALIFGVLSRALAPFLIPTVVFCILTGGFLGMACKGSKFQAQLKRQKRYLQIMGERDTCTLEELSAGIGKSKKYVQRDLREMIQNHMFPQGAYLDAGGTCLMTSHTAYRQYQDVMKQYEQRRVQEETAKRAAGNGRQEWENRETSEAGDGSQSRRTEAGRGSRREKAETGTDLGLSEEIREILRDGKEFIAHIHECNDALPGPEISDKLNRLEMVVTKIFNQVEQKPESAPDLRKMMSYYLPITRKLVDAYRDLDAQQVEGQNIGKTKKEIQDSLDTINTAFENLLDSFFQDTAWDISTDITVLRTMMAQDGLMKQDFETEKETQKGEKR